MNIKFSKLLKKVPSKIALKVGFEMSDIKNWKNGEYFGNRKLINLHTDIALDEIAKQKALLLEKIIEKIFDKETDISIVIRMEDKLIEVFKEILEEDKIAPRIKEQLNRFVGQPWNLDNKFSMEKIVRRILE